MEPLFEKVFQVRSYEVDFTGRVRVSTLLNFLQEAAGDHARLLGVAVRDLMRHGLTWVLSRTHLRCFDTAHSREEILVRTWPSLRQGRFTCREFELFGSDGRPVAAATCSFAVLDLESRRPIMIDDRLPHYPLLPTRAIDDPFATLPRLGDFDVEKTFRVGMADLDVNGHANNVSYADWTLETIPLDLARSCRLADIQIAYRAEVLYDQTVVSRCRATGEGPEFLHQLIRGEDGMELTRVVSRWEKV
jgi:medium-chain acyl-[acyl-carrier-protein] hydrolase